MNDDTFPDSEVPAPQDVDAVDHQAPVDGADESVGDDAREPAAVAPGEPAAAGAAGAGTTETPGRRRLGVAAAAGGLILLGLLVASQVYLVTTLNDTNTELEAARADVAALEGELAGMSITVDELTVEVADLESSLAAGAASSTAPATPAGFLPQYVQGQPDAALGLVLGPIEGPDAYTEQVVAIDPADGTKRIWMTWAHWCPYCQEELPSLVAVHGDLESDYPDIELVTVSTSIDPARGNPLEPYLEEQQFPFPVLIDADLGLAGQMGASAFPFWVVTDGDGTVLFRSAGYLDDASVLGLIDSLDAYEAQA